MYNQFFGLVTLPFGMTPDPSCLYMTAQYKEAVAGLMYAVLSRKGFCVLTGDAGTGKTTLLAKMLATARKTRVHTSIVFHPTLTRDEFLEFVLLQFGMENVPESKAQRLKSLERFLLECHEDRSVAALVVDEAHRLSPEVLEEIRLLGNFDRDGQKLLQIVLVGQTELDEILRRHDFRQLKQRVAVRLKIGPLKKAEVPDYIERRWTLAGGTKAPFDPPAVERIAEYSNGLPRLVNALCDNSLLLAFGEQSRRVETRHVDEGAKDLELWRLDAVQGTERPAESHTPAAGSALPAAPANGHQSDTIPGPLRVPAFTSLESERPSMLSRWTGRLKPGTS